MWNSSDDSDTPASADYSRKPAKDLPKGASKVKSSDPKGKPASQSSLKTQPLLSVETSDSHTDSDSSGGKWATKNQGSARAAGSAPVQQAAKPKPETGARPKAPQQRKETVASRKRPESAKQNKAASSSSTQGAHLPSTPQTSETASENFSAFNDSDFPALGSRSPPKKKVPARQAPTASQTSVPKSAHSGGNPGKARSFEKHQAKDSDRGQQFSRREEKLSFSDFLPQSMQSKKSKKKGGKNGGQGSGQRTPMEGPSTNARGSHRAEDPSSGAAAKKGQDKTKEGPPANAGDSQRAQDPRSGAAAKKGCEKTQEGPSKARDTHKAEDLSSGAAAKKGQDKTEPEAGTSSAASSKPSYHPHCAQGGKSSGGGTKPKSGTSLEHRDDSSATDSSDDEDVSEFLSSKPTFVPPSKKPFVQENPQNATTPEVRDDSPPEVPPAEMAPAPEEETVPKQVVGDWPRGQRGGNKPFRGRREHRYPLNRNQREQGNPRQRRAGPMGGNQWDQGHDPRQQGGHMGRNQWDQGRDPRQHGGHMGGNQWDQGHDPRQQGGHMGRNQWDQGRDPRQHGGHIGGNQWDQGRDPRQRGGHMGGNQWDQGRDPRQHGGHMGGNWGELGHEPYDPQRFQGRGNQHNRHLRNNGNMFWGENPQYENFQREQGGRGDGPNRPNYGEPQRPPPRERAEQNVYQERRQDAHRNRPAGNRQPNRPQPAGLRPLEANLSFTRLRELKSKEPAEVVAALSYSKEGLVKLLKNEEKLKKDTTLLRMLLTCLAKVAVCQSMPAQSSEILNLVRTSSCLRILGSHLLASYGMLGEPGDVFAMIGETADLLRTLVILFPSYLPDVVMADAFLKMAQSCILLREVGELPPDVCQKMNEFNLTQEAAVKELQQKESKKSRVEEDAQTPPNDFRQISVFPTMDDLNKEGLPFLRKNKEKGGYLNLDHYLDVQFRLLREDFVYPLREGIAEYLKMVAAPQQGRKLKDIRVYHDVHILRAVCLPNGLGHRLTFDVSRMKRVRWEVSKRLIYGSLVCLSADNFQTLFFATVVNREPADLQEGMVDVSFEHNLEELSAIPPEATFTMAETTAFFEAYRHVLSGLQRLQAHQMPFEKYIVKCEKTVSEPSFLLNNETQPVKYDLRPLVDESIALREDQNLVEQGRDVAYKFSNEAEQAKDVPVLHKRDWPPPQLLHLDDSQFEALHQALTKEFSVIQGPPGTGKTYVGLKVVKALLHNRRCWDPFSNSCMLIVCFTNHALDQFLEGVISFFNGSVVRVGSRLRSEKLEPYTLNSMRWNMRRKRDGVDRDFREITRLRFQGHEAMDRLKREVDSMGLKIESAKREILHEDVLMPYMLDHHYDRLVDARSHFELKDRMIQKGRPKHQVLCIPEWLGISMVLQNAAHMTPEQMLLLEELGRGEEEGGGDIEGEVQALEDQHRLDTDDPLAGSDKERKEKEKKRAMARERTSYLAVDISKLDQGMDRPEQKDGGRGGPGEGAFQIPRAQWKKIKRKLRRTVELDDRMTEAEERQVGDLWTLDIPQRWRLYRRWTHNLYQALKEEMSERERLYDELARRQQETLMQEDKHILKTATVIAMTTTAAARYQSVLQEVKPRIIVVEEAAEVLEGHVITTLSQDCKQLILIGDHKQLRPNPTVYALARKYNLELSLFERMINNGLKCTTLGWQHRMRPEIAALVKPIYPELNNHPKVEDYEAVKGVTSNLFFINHSELEASDEETKSHANIYEAQYAAMLCQYLLKQGYHPDRISVLTTYSGQLFQLRKLMPRKTIFEGVRVTVVDNFQGEENDIIILSLVRSNEDNNIGFLKIENRVCVALSRAKMGLYVIGNFDLLSAESNLWQRITTELRREGKLGEVLPLYCQNHPGDKGLVIRKPEDFNFAPEGGCMKPCTTRLDCGHVCMRLCHPYDQDHTEYQCSKNCERKMDCEFQHPCKKKCFQECGDCDVKVRRQMPRCGHWQYMNCSMDVEYFVCQEPCPVVLMCGHKCGDVCGERHKCYEKVTHTWPCGHVGEVACAEKDSTPCTYPCAFLLSCGHFCTGACYECHSGRLHKQCSKNCSKILVCGHTCRDMCSNCPPCIHKCENRCVHSSCPKRCGQPCAPCIEPCAWRCPHHRCHRLCHEPCDRPRCDQPCPKFLPCDHPCIGLCGEPCPRLCPYCNPAEAREIFFGTEDDPNARFVQLEDCQHVLEVSGLDQWMTTTTDTHEDSVHLKACPICKTPIRQNLRYGAIIKTQLNDIEIIKGKMQGDNDLKTDIITDIEMMIEDENEPSYEAMKQDIWEAGEVDCLESIVAMKNQMAFLEETKKVKLLRKKKSLHGRVLVEAIEMFEKWLCQKRVVFSEQEQEDSHRELLRLKQWLALLMCLQVAPQRGVKLPASLTEPANHTLEVMKNGLRHSSDLVQSTSDLVRQMQALIPESCLGVSEAERVMIVKAMYLSQGHWFKCPEGHIYAIADCGGATEESRCPECQAIIGGTQHRLREDNRLAPEMDGATQPAWPNTLEDSDDDMDDMDDEELEQQFIHFGLL